MSKERERGSKDPAHPEGAPVVARMYDLLLWYIPVLVKFPRDLRFTLGDRLHTALLDAHGALTDAAYGRDKAPPLAVAQKMLDRARLLTRLAHDLRALDHRRYGFASELLVEVGSMIGGWRRASAR